MSERDKTLYIDDIIDSIQAIKTYVADMSYDDFARDRKTYSATIREYIIIGEAVQKLMPVLSEQYPDYQWRMIKDFRNYIVHEYFGVNSRLLWDLTTIELDQLLEIILDLRQRN